MSETANDIVGSYTGYSIDLENQKIMFLIDTLYFIPFNLSISLKS